jgi:hypothetical protein
MNALASLLVLALAARDDAVTNAQGTDDGLAGLDGFLTRSTIVFAGHDDEPHALEAVYMLPDRARFSLQRLDSPVRVSEYRRGAAAWRFAPDAGVSSRLERDERRALLLRMELRRAAMLWPDGFAWTSLAPGEGTDERVCRVPDPDPAASVPLGELCAAVDGEGRAVRVSATIEGVEMERLWIDAWQSVLGRSWPRSLRLAVGDVPVWSEWLETVRTDVFFTDLVFLPHDRRLASPATRAERNVLSRDLIPMTYRALALPEGCTWSAALDEAERALERAAEELRGRGLTVDPTPRIELSRAGRPRSVLVRHEGAPTPPPEGFTAVDERPGLIELVPSLAAVTPERIEALRRALPEGQEGGPPYVRVDRTERGLRVHLTLPIRDAR